MPRNYFVTIRAHPTEVQVFEDFFKLFQIWLKKANYYYYSIEEDKTPARHAHILINDNAKDMEKFLKKLKNKTFQDYFNKMKDNHTNLDPKFKDGFINVKYVTDDNVTIGYIFKSNNSRIHVGLLQSQEIQECVNAYWITQKSDSRKMSKDKPIRLLNTKNAHGFIQSYCENHDMSVKSRDLKYKMEKDFHSFDNISPQNVNRIFRTMRIMLNQEEEDDKYNSCCEVTITKDTDYEIRKREDDIKSLLQIIVKYQSHLDSKELYEAMDIKSRNMIYLGE